MYKIYFFAADGSGNIYFIHRSELASAAKYKIYFFVADGSGNIYFLHRSELASAAM